MLRCQAASGFASHLEAVFIPDILGQRLDFLDKGLGALLHDISLDVCPESPTPHLQKPMTWSTHKPYWLKACDKQVAPSSAAVES